MEDGRTGCKLGGFVRGISCPLPPPTGSGLQIKNYFLILSEHIMNFLLLHLHSFGMDGPVEHSAPCPVNQNARGDRSAAQIEGRARSRPAGSTGSSSWPSSLAGAASVHASRNGNNSQGEAVVSFDEAAARATTALLRLSRSLAHRHSLA